MFGGQKKLVMCQACRGLISSSESTCPLCGRDAVPPARARINEVTGTDHFISRLILTINIAIFVMMLIADIRAGGDTSQVLMRPGNTTFYAFGGRLISLINQGEWWRIITPNFIHLGIMHLLFNSFALYQIGPLVEELYGSQKFIFLYLATGIVSNLAAYTFFINGAGASGSIFGLIGLMAVYGYRIGGAFGRGLMRQMLIWAAFGILMGFGIGADNVSHIGGMIAGAVFGFIIKPEEPSTSRAAFGWNTAAVASAALVTISFVMVAVNYSKPIPGSAGLNDESGMKAITYFNHMRDAEEGLIDSYNAFIEIINAKNSAASIDAARSAADKGLASLNGMPLFEGEASQYSQQLRGILTDQPKAVDQFAASKEKDWNAAQSSMRSTSDRLDQFRTGYSAWLPKFLEEHGLILKAPAKGNPSS